jgi:transcriptional regulator with XRE-family HTH domain
MQVPRTYISKIENGKAIPTLGSLERLASALEVDICQLVRDGRSARDEEMAEIFADPFLAELAQYLPKLEALHRSLLMNQVRERAREALRESSMGKRRTA